MGRHGMLYVQHGLIIHTRPSSAALGQRVAYYVVFSVTNLSVNREMKPQVGSASAI